MSEATNNELSVTTSGDVGAADISYAASKISRLLSHVDGPVLFAEVRLTQEADPARERPSVAKAVLDVNGQPVRAHVAAQDMAAATDLLEDRLRRRLERHAHVRDDRRARLREHDGVDAHEWRHGELTSQRPEYFDRPADEREVVRRPTYATGQITPDEAVDQLDLLGHDFLLFTNCVTGADAVIAYNHDLVLELVDASNREDAIGADTVAPVKAGRAEALRGTPAEAIEQLDLGVAPFVFFVDPATGRGAVVYHRYDGHYGLVTAT